METAPPALLAGWLRRSEREFTHNCFIVVAPDISRSVQVVKTESGRPDEPIPFTQVKLLSISADQTGFELLLQTDTLVQFSRADGAASESSQPSIADWFRYLRNFLPITPLNALSVLPASPQPSGLPPLSRPPSTGPEPLPGLSRSSSIVLSERSAHSSLSGTERPLPMLPTPLFTRVSSVESIYSPMSPGLPISPTSPSQIKFNRWRSIPLAVADETNINTSAVVESPSSSASVAAAVSTSAVTASKPVWTPPVYGPEHEQAARVIQDAWRAYRHRRAEAAVVIQRAWRNFKGIPNPSFSQSSDLPVLLQPSVTSVSFQFGLPNAPRMSPSHSVDGSMEFSPIAARSPKPSRRMSIPMLISEHIKRNRTVSAASLKKHMMANSQQSDQNADNTSGSVDNALRSMGAFHDNYLNIAPLPPAFPGAAGLTLPPYLPSSSSGVTIPARLRILGNSTFAVSAVTNASDIGNAVVGRSFSWLAWSWNAFVSTLLVCLPNSLKSWKIQEDRTLHVLPKLNSAELARMSLFMRAQLLLFMLMFIGESIELIPTSQGTAWILGTMCSLYVMYSVSNQRWNPGGVIPFCRSMGTPEVEEFMFSYSWKQQENDIRTLAKAVWNAGAGVWIDVLKLSAGDEIRPVTRTMVRACFRSIVFLSKSYISSPNCCIEFWEAAQFPEKLTICILDDIPEGVSSFIRKLERQGTRIVNGLDELVPLIHADLSNRLDMSAYSWWKNQNISGGGATLSIAPDEDWTIPKYRLCSSQMFRPSNSLHVGPLFLAGNCQTTGYSASWPWLMLCSLVGLVIHALDVYLKSMGTDHGTSAEFGIIFDVLMIVNSLSPFLTMGRLYETRTNCSMALRNLLASRAIGNGVRLEIIGDPSDPVASTLWQFSRHIGHGFREMTQPNWSQCVLKVEDGDDVPDLNLSAATVATTDSKRSKEATFNLSTDLRVRVHVMSTMQHRDTLFGAAGGDLACIAAMDQRRSVFVWTGDEDPFTDDEIGRRMLKYLIISAKVERHHLAQTIFAAIGVRVVDVLHD